MFGIKNKYLKLHTIGKIWHLLLHNFRGASVKFLFLERRLGTRIIVHPVKIFSENFLIKVLSHSAACEATDISSFFYYFSSSVLLLVNQRRTKNL